MSSAFGDGPKPPSTSHFMFTKIQTNSNFQVLLNLINVLTDLKFTLARSLLMRGCFEKVFPDFE